MLTINYQSAFFPGMQFILGSWYRGDEIARRGAFFYVGQTVGAMSTGLLTGSIATTFGGHHGISGWRWMFVFTSVITIPIALLGYLLYPGTPSKPNKILLTNENIEIARRRLQRYGHADNDNTVGNTSLDWATIKRSLRGELGAGVLSHYIRLIIGGLLRLQNLDLFYYRIDT